MIIIGTIRRNLLILRELLNKSYYKIRGFMMEVQKLGLWSSIAATFFGTLFITALIMTLIGAIPRPWDTFWQVLPSIFLAWSYMIMMLCFYKTSSENRNVWSLAGFTFSIIYATINSIVYFTILTLVIPGMLNGKSEELSILLFEPNKFLFHINGLAYTLMSIAALFSLNAFSSKGNEAKVKWTMLAHGLIAPFVGGAVIWAPLTYFGALWIITFPMMGIAAILYFRNYKHCLGGESYARNKVV